FFSSRRRHTRFSRDWSSDVCSSDLLGFRHCLQSIQRNRVIQMKRPDLQTPERLQMCATAQEPSDILSQSTYISAFTAMHFDVGMHAIATEQRQRMNGNRARWPFERYLLADRKSTRLNSSH